MVPCGVAIIVVKFINNIPYFLFGKRKGSHGAGEYSLPGGRLEPNETGIHRAITELLEETGIHVEDHRMTKFGTLPYGIANAGGQPWVTLFFSTVVPADCIAITKEPDKCEGWDWYEWENIPTPYVWFL